MLAGWTEEAPGLPGPRQSIVPEAVTHSQG